MNQRFKRILLILGIPLLLGGIVHYTVSYKIKNILKLLVEKESDNSYAFNASKIEVSFWNKNLIVENARLISTDTTTAKTHYNIEIPKMYLGIQSWSDILFNRKVAIDSCSIIDSKFGIHEKSLVQKDTARANVNLKDIFASIEKTLLFLEVKSLTIQNTGFSYKSIHSKKVLSGNGINFSIQNLSKDNKDGHLLYSDDIEVNVKNQKWDLPDGIHSISFKSLNFSGEDQFFELDSFTVHSEKKDDKGEINLFTEKFFFNSLELSAMYEKDILEIDTLLCVRPVLTIDIENKDTAIDQKNTRISSKKNSSTKLQPLDKFLPELFKEKHINYINIEDGQVLIKNNKNPNPNALIQKSNLKIYNLSLSENRQPYFKSDSILFGLKDIAFVTPDSTFQVVASELLIINNDLVLRNSFFGPTKPTSSKKSISFTAPEFRLIDIDFFNLIQKKLSANKAELYSPKIVVRSANHEEQAEMPVSGGIDRFYASLHEFRELIGIEKLQITNGDILVHTSNKQNAVVHLQGIDALVLPIHFMNSDSLVEIKHSMPEIKINAITIQSDKMNVSIRNYTFDGIHRKNYADYVHLNLQQELDIEAKKLYWEIFDWDLFQKYKRIDIKEFAAQQLSVKTAATETHKTTKGPRKDLPDIRVEKLNIGELYIRSASANDTLSLTAHHVVVDSLRTTKRFFTWKKVDGIYENIHLKKEHLTAHIKLLKFNALTEVVIQNISIDQKENGTNMHVQIPAVTILGNFYSTDFSVVSMQKLHIQNPAINYTIFSNGLKKDAPKKEFSIPIKLYTKDLTVENASINYKKESLTDTLQFASNVSIHLKNITTSKDGNELLRYDQLALTIQKLALTNKGIALTLPQAALVSADGSITTADKTSLSIGSNVSLNWTGLSVLKNNVKADSHIAFENCSGALLNNYFVYNTAKPVEWKSILSNIVIHGGALRFNNPKIVFSAQDLNWKNQSLVLNNISLQPKLSKAEAFKKADAQFDYLTLAGKAIRVNGINVAGSGEHQSLYISKVILDQFELSSSRDKNLPKQKFKLKEMPTKLIQKIPLPLQIDSVLVHQANVHVHQIEAKSTEESTIPISNINALITNISNRNEATDSLTLRADAKLLNINIRTFNYTESYTDSLSYFHASSTIIPGKFADINPITVPLASIFIDNGSSNKLNAWWVGNKYATIGTMDFIYKDLKIHLINKGDTSKTTLAERLESSLANDIIHTKNSKTSVIFFERNTQKQIFNYWLKAMLQGVYSSVGVKSNKKYLNQYDRVKEKYHLPENPSEEEKNKPLL